MNTKKTDGFSGAIVNRLQRHYYDPQDRERPFFSGDKTTLKVLIKAHSKIKKHKKLRLDELEALLHEDECDWTSFERSHDEKIKYLYIQGNIKDDDLYDRLIEVEKQRFNESLKLRKIVSFCIQKV